ncbi:D-hexose-6-phosphate mutarotase [Solimonas terrae]|uniref:Putative glucose-6-phosphate 1-epimerase n=1 Tax=Solimonas terrae TaxID=1396819 RepID=A0A6M2BSX4_9GAMM|nr:D-hexose-6-phosphate mutarotase [Solimonas terrae]NGY05331.1 D-hexose-6-phosphate mutarotase [Solimonas terrae]
MNTIDAHRAWPTLELVSADGARAEISAHGAQVVSWRPRRGGERLYLSGKAQAGPGQTIRGGVPVVFPQFAFEGELPKHGFVRNVPWSLLAHGDGHVRYGLHEDARTLALWPHAFAAELSVEVHGDTLRIGLKIRNTGDRAFRFTAALHSYLRVEDIGRARIAGLQGLRYRDKVRGDSDHVESRAELGIDGEVDRIYFDATSPLTMRDGMHGLDIRHEGFADTVVWNPGVDKAAELHDLDDGGWQRMLCIEAAAIGEPVELQPGQAWSGTQTLEAR